MKRMQWSKLKSRVKERICPELRDIIDFHVTSYRRAHDDVEKVWITVNGEMIYSIKYYSYHRAIAEAFFCGLSGAAIRSVLREIEIFQPKDFGNALRSYLDLPIQDALASSNPLIKAFAIIDRRAGKRTLAKLEVSDSEHPLVRTFYSLRVD
jgi:hypothetical protein